MARVLIILLLVTCLFVPTQSQNIDLEWGIGWGAEDRDQCNAVAVDDSGNVYTTGWFSGTVDFDPGPNIFNLTAYYGSDVFVAKFDATGGLVWAVHFRGEAFDPGVKSIRLDQANNVYVLGNHRGLTDFDPGLGTFEVSYDTADAYLCKLSANGDFRWVRTWKGFIDIDEDLLAVDAQSNLLIAGTLDGVTDLNPNAGTFFLSPVSMPDVVICKLDSAGNFRWAKSFGGSGQDYCYGISVDLVGNVYTTGEFGGTVDFDPGLGSFPLTASPKASYISKLDSAGNFVWAQPFPSVNLGIANDSAGNVYTIGHFQNAADFDPGPSIALLSPLGAYDGVILKLDPSGNFVWAKQIGGTSSSVFPFSIASDASANVYAVGDYMGTVDFDPSSATALRASLQNENTFLLKLDATGDFRWMRDWWSENEGFTYEVKVDAAENIYAAGSFSTALYYYDTLHANPILTIPLPGMPDAFLLKFKQTPLSTAHLEPYVSVTAFPNPSPSKFNIDLGALRQHTSIALYDVQGRLHSTATYNYARTIQVQLQGPAGVYLLHVISDGSQATLRLRKE